MKEYIVSARKYRPMSFDSVVGQSSLTTTLKNAVKIKKLAHAYLFCGPRGVGKTTCARIFAKAINCQNPTEDGEACNQCESCAAFNEQRSYNIFELDAASNNSVENIKTLMEQTRIAPQVGRYKVFIIDEVHMLSTQAFNAFLKTLEEPPAHVIFILATTEKHKILPTIISRCQIYDFERMTVANIIAHLKQVADKEGITYDEEALSVIAEKADGGMRDALSIFDQTTSFCQGNITYDKVIEDLNILDSENYFNVIDYCVDNKVSDVMVLLNNVIGKGFDGGHFISGLAAHVRNVLMAKDEQTTPLLEVSERQVQRFKEQAAKCPTKFLYNALKLMNNCDINYRQSSNKRLLVELTLIQIAQLTQPDEDNASAGRSPIMRLKSLFKKIVANTGQNETLQVVGTGKKANASNETKTEGDTSGKSNTALPPADLHITNEKGSGSQKDTTASAKPEYRIKKIAALGKTFSNLTPQKGKIDVVEESIAETPSASEDFNEEMLQLQWYAMCNRISKIKELTAIATRMSNITPTIKDFPTVEIVADSKMLYDEICKIKGRIRTTLAQNLQNNNIELVIRIAKQEEIKAILSPRELLTQIQKDSPAIEKLCSELKLDIC